MVGVLNRINKIVERICAVLMIVLTLETFYVIIMRYVFNDTPLWGEVISRFLMVYACMFGFSIGINDNSHIRIKAIDRVLPERVIYYLDWFAIACMAAFSIFMIVEGVAFTVLCSGNTISGLGLKSSYEMVCIPVGGLFCLLQTIRGGLILWRIR